MVNEALPAVSIVVPAYNAEETIGPLLDSLLALNYPDFEVIVVNDGSEDNTKAIVQEYPVKLIDQPNRGASAARDAGLRATSGQILAYVDSDVTVTDEWLRKLVAPFRHSDIAATTGKTIFKTGNRCASWLRSLDIERRHLRRRKYTRLANGPNCAFRRQVLLEVGGFDPSWYHAEDTEVSYKIWAAGYKIRYVSEAIVYHTPEDNWHDYLRKRFRDSKAFARMLLRYPTVAILKDDFVSVDMKVQTALYAVIFVLTFAVPISVGTSFFASLVAVLVGGFVLAFLFGLREAVPVTRESMKPIFFSQSVGLSILKGYAWVLGLISGIISQLSSRRKKPRPLVLSRSTTGSHDPDASTMAVLDFYEQYPCGGDRHTDDKRWSRLGWMEREFKPKGHAGQIVLDLGCGIGIDMQEFAGRDVTIVGVDFAEAPLLMARHRLSAAPSPATYHLVRADARFLPFRSEVFDYFYSNGVIHHIPDCEVALEEAQRCLKYGREGTVLVYHTRSLMTVLTMLARTVSSKRENGWRSLLLLNSNPTSATAAGFAEVLRHPLIQYFSRATLHDKLHQAGFLTLRTRSYDWSFPIGRRKTPRQSGTLDQWFGRFLVATVQKTSR